MPEGVTLPWLTFADISRRTPAPDTIRPNQAARAGRSRLVRAREVTRIGTAAKHSGQGPMFRQIADCGSMRFWRTMYYWGLAGFQISHTGITPSPAVINCHQYR